MAILYANPYDTSASGFYFCSKNEYAIQYASNVNEFGLPVEEYEIEFIDGTDIECAIATAMKLDQCNFERFFDLIDETLESEEHDIIAFCIALQDNIVKLDNDTRIAEFSDNMVIFYADSAKDFAEQWIEDGNLGDIPDHLQSYIDVDSVARDLLMDYTEANVLGQTVFYHSH